jgi:hypothetical protein
MNNYKSVILNNICYTERVYDRINKKLQLQLSKKEIEVMIFSLISQTDDSKFHKKGKNIYIHNLQKNIILTINSYTNRIITADKFTNSLFKNKIAEK